jgi:hypothetical protein
MSQELEDKITNLSASIDALSTPYGRLRISVSYADKTVTVNAGSGLYDEVIEVLTDKLTEEKAVYEAELADE